MSKHLSVIIVFLIIFLSCKKMEDNKGFPNEKITSKENISISKNPSSKEKLQSEEKSKIGVQNFQSFFQAFENVRKTGKNHSDWMTDKRSYKLSKLLGIHKNDYNISTTSYAYEENCIFYVHSLNHIVDSISFKKFIHNPEGQFSSDKLSERVLIFALKNEKEANFIDIPPNWGYSKIRTELIKKIYANLNGVVISCDTTRVCERKDLRH